MDMKEGWEKRRFDEIMTPARVERCGDRTDLPILSITMRSGIVEQRDRFSKTIASVDRSNYKIVKDGQLVIAFPIDEGLVYTQDVAKEGIMSPAYNIWDVDYSLVNRNFLVSYFHSRFAFDYYKAKLRGSTQRRRSMDKEDLLSMPIPVPPISEQKRIVEELDLLNGIIEKNKTQLEELDKLAQSIFYDMFGDPKINELGWDSESFSNLFLLKSGDSLSAKEFEEGIYPVYGGNGIAGYHNKYNKEGDYIIIGRVGVYCGNVRIVSNKFWLTDNAFELIMRKDAFNKSFLSYLLNIMNLNQYANHAAQPVISNVVLKEINVPVPSLFLQQEFADKISAIEAMKEKVRKSLAEAEQLFNSRMDFYFN